jgi:hypothetical protein
MLPHIVPCLAAVWLFSAQSPPAPVYAFANGNVFDGERFSHRTFYVVAGVLRFERPTRVDSLIDLRGRWVIPPFADAHTHMVGDGMDPALTVERLLQEGVFYLKNTNSTPRRSAEARRFINQPAGVDVIYAWGGLTSRHGHPVPLYESVVRNGAWPGWTLTDLDGQAFYAIDDTATLSARWPSILQAKPDFLKVYLEHSENHDRPRASTGHSAARGLDPALLPAVVQRARAARLRVSAHVTTAADVTTAMAAGVDELSHLPLAPLSAEQIRQLVERRTWVVTTITSHRPAGGVADPLRLHALNLSRLMDAGVSIAIGTDNNDVSVLNEAAALCRLGVISNAVLLRLWTQETPRAIFPERRIGRLVDGYEASFLVLTSNPLEDFRAVHQPWLRVKQGHSLQATRSSLPPAPATPSNCLAGS